MKNKEYLFCTITTKEGRTFNNALKLSEAKLIPQILRENKRVIIERIETLPDNYKALFS